MPKRNALQATISNRLMKRQGTTASCTAQSKDFKETSSLHCQKRLFSQRSHTSQENNWACWSNLKHGGLQVCLQRMSCVSKTCAQVTATQGRVEAAKKCCLSTYWGNKIRLNQEGRPSTKMEAYFFAFPSQWSACSTTSQTAHDKMETGCWTINPYQSCTVCPFQEHNQLFI